MPRATRNFGDRSTFVNRWAIPPKRASAFVRAAATEVPNAGATSRQAVAQTTNSDALMIDFVGDFGTAETSMMKAWSETPPIDVAAAIG